jgi:hypothetical protein
MWYFYSPVGTFTIARNSSGGYVLWIDNEQLNTYIGPEAAAEAVRLKNTGFKSWDDLENVEAPANLNQWIPVTSPRGCGK